MLLGRRKEWKQRKRNRGMEGDQWRQKKGGRGCRAEDRILMKLRLDERETDHRIERENEDLTNIMKS